MNIVIFTSGLTGGGAERVALMWASGFINKGYQVTIGTDLRPGIAYEIPDGLEVVQSVAEDFQPANSFEKTIHRQPSLWHLYHRIKYEHLNVVLMSELIDQKHPDVVIGVGSPVNFPAFRAAKKMKVPYIGTEHNSFETPELNLPAKSRNDNRVPGLYFYKFWLSRFYDALTVLTEADLRLIKGKIKNAYCLPNPLQFKPTESIDGKEKLIVACGRLDSWYVKGFDLLIKAWGIVSPKHPDWKLDIGGKGSDKTVEFLNGLIKENNVEKTTILSGFHKDDIETFYSKASIFVMSSRYEGFGLVLIEAMSQGCAPVACDFKGRASEIVRNESEGLCVDIDSVEEIEAGIERMITDEEYRKSVQNAAIRRSTDYSIDNIMVKWDNILDKVIKL